MFRWDDLRVFLGVHRGGTLAAAGRLAGVDASTASRRLRALEDDLGARLFDRTPDGLVATDLGLRLLAPAEQAEAAALAIAAEAAGEDDEPVGEVRVALADAFAAYIVAPALGAFQEAHPGVRLSLQVSTALVDLSRREADVALRFARPTQGDLVYRRVGQSIGYAGFVSASYAARHPDLRRETVAWIGWSEDKAHFPEAQLYQRVVGLPLRMACDNMIVMMEAVRAGAGAMILPVGIADVEPTLVEVPGTRTPDFESTAWVVTHRALKDVPRVRLVVDWLAELMTP